MYLNKANETSQKVKKLNCIKKHKSKTMANIPPKKFYLISKSEQEDYAVAEMKKHQQLSDLWRHLSIQARKKQIPEPKEIDRPDEQLLKDGI